jgi:hypothetical protein
MENICEEGMCMHSPSLAHINNHLPEQAQPNPTYDMKHRQTFLQLGKEEN